MRARRLPIQVGIHHAAGIYLHARCVIYDNINSAIFIAPATFVSNRAGIENEMKYKYIEYLWVPTYLPIIRL